MALSAKKRSAKQLHLNLRRGGGGYSTQIFYTTEKVKNVSGTNDCFCRRSWPCHYPRGKLEPNRFFRVPGVAVQMAKGGRGD